MADHEGQPVYLPNDSSFSTCAIHSGSNPDKWRDGDIMLPINLSTTYKQDLPPGHKGLQYTRLKNSTRASLEECIASLEKTKYCLTVSAGMAAAFLTSQLLQDGDHAVVQTSMYFGVTCVYRDIDRNCKNIDVTFADTSDLVNVEKALRPNTKLVWLETPSNPLLKLVDLKAVRSLVKAHNPSTIIACDNTFMSPYFQRPATFGIDIVMHSCTKYMGGHSDVLMGALCMNDDNIYNKLLQKQITLGPIPSSFDCYLMMRSLKTLEVRMEKHMSNGLKVAKFLESHPMIEKVLHPGLPSHPQHQLSLRQCYGHSGMLSFYIKCHDLKVTRKFVQNLKIIRLAESLGGVDTIMKLPSQMPPGALTPEEMDAQGINDGFLRLSVGLENPQDLINDLKDSLDSLI